MEEIRTSKVLSELWCLRRGVSLSVVTGSSRADVGKFPNSAHSGSSRPKTFLSKAMLQYMTRNLNIQHLGKYIDRYDSRPPYKLHIKLT